MPLSLRALQKYFLVGSNAALNIMTPLAILDHVASCLNLHEGTPQQQESTRLAIVGVYTLLVLGMELISAERMTEEVMAPVAPELAGEGYQEAAFNNLEGRHWHKGVLVVDSLYKTIGKTAAAMMVIGKLNAGRLAATLTGLTLGVGGYLHARHPPLHRDDIIHESNAPGRSAYREADFVSTLFWLGTAASAVNNTIPYVTAYKMVARELSDAFLDSDASPSLDENIFFLAMVLLGALSMMYSKFLLARNRSADIWDKHAAAATWRDWFRLLDRWALVGAAAHSVLGYCNDWALMGDYLPDQLSLALSTALPAASFLGTYATNADYSGWDVRSGLLEYSPMGSPGWGERWQNPGNTMPYMRLPPKENKARRQGLGDESPDSSPSLIREAKGVKGVFLPNHQPKVVAKPPLSPADEKLVATPEEKVSVVGKSGENYGCAARLFARFRHPQQTVEPSVRSPFLTSKEGNASIAEQPSAAHPGMEGGNGLS